MCSQLRAGRKAFCRCWHALCYSTSGSEDEVIAAATACNADGLLIQYAPVTERVLSALPRGYLLPHRRRLRHHRPESLRQLGVWLANSPDYGVGEVATHALALALDIIRGTTFHTADIRAGKVALRIKRQTPSRHRDDARHRGLGRIGKRMAHVSRNLFKRVIAYDPI